MKKITFLFALLTISLGFGQNLLSSGGFEGLPGGKITATTTDWTSSQTNSQRQTAVNNNVDNAFEGEQYANLVNDFTNFRQPFTAVANTQYTVTAQIRFNMGQGQITDPDDGLFIQIRNDIGGNGENLSTPIELYIDPTQFSPAVWKEVTFNFTAPQSNLLFYVYKRSRNDDGDGGLNNSCFMDAISVTTATLSLDNLKQFSFSSYPNPATDYINLSAAKNIEKIEVYNLLGKQVLRENISSRTKEVNVSNLSDGVYIMKAYIEDAVGTYKFVKQ